MSVHIYFTFCYIYCYCCHCHYHRHYHHHSHSYCPYYCHCYLNYSSLGFAILRRLGNWYKGMAEYELLLDHTDFDYQAYGGCFNGLGSALMASVNQTAVREYRYSNLVRRLRNALGKTAALTFDLNRFCYLGCLFVSILWLVMFEAFVCGRSHEAVLAVMLYICIIIYLYVYLQALCTLTSLPYLYRRHSLFSPDDEGFLPWNRKRRRSATRR